MRFVFIRRVGAHEGPTGGSCSVRFSQETAMDVTTLLIIVIVVLLVGGGFYGRGRWY